LAQRNVTHVTITVNAIDPSVGEKIYAWVRDKNKLYRGREAATLLWERQAAAIQALRRHNIIVKINTIIIPGINDNAIEPVAKTVASLGASIMNCMPLYPVEGAAFANMPAPDKETMHRVRAEAGKYLPLMAHCMRCRADAAGLLGSATSNETVSLLKACAALPLDGSGKRTNVAVTSRESVLVNEHLGHAQRFLIYRNSDTGYEFCEERISPAGLKGDDRWNALADILADCKAVVVEHVGTRPRQVLEKKGLRVVAMSALIEEGLDIAFSGKPVPAHLAGGCASSCGSSCKCTGSGEGC
jgi:nitrogen fixation protein NifB